MGAAQQAIGVAAAERPVLARTTFDAEPEVDKLPAWTRLAVLIIATALSWALVLGAAALLLGR